jgi:hypothetical protein
LAQPAAGKRAKFAEIPPGGLEKGKPAPGKESEKADDIQREAESPIGQAAPPARSGDAAAANTEIPAGGGKGPGQAAATESWEGHGTDTGGTTTGGMDPDGTDPDGGKRNAGEMEDAVSNIEEAKQARAEPDIVNWDGRAVRSAMDQMTQRVMEAHEMARAQQENIREQQDRLAAMELRVRMLEERGRINRDGGG